MSLDSDPAEIGILLYPGAQLAAIHGLTDLFAVASRVARERGGAGAPMVRVSHWQPGKVGEAVERVFATHPDLPGRPCVIIVPPSLGDPPDRAMAARLARWLTDRHVGGSVLCSVCAGAFLLAETGLLDGRAATTHWGHAKTLAQRYPRIHVDADKLIVEDGDVITAGGLMAWIDLGLKLTDRLLGSSIMLETARFLLVDPPGREQRYYSNFSPRLRHGDEAVLKVQHWLQAQGAREASIPAMAARGAGGAHLPAALPARRQGSSPPSIASTCASARRARCWSSPIAPSIRWPGTSGMKTPAPFARCSRR